MSWREEQERTVRDQPNPHIMRRARDFYAIYCASSDGKNFRGDPCPPWDALPEAVRGHWYTVALRSLELLVEGIDAIGRETGHPPSKYSTRHLGDQRRALDVWREYSGPEAF